MEDYKETVRVARLAEEHAMGSSGGINNGSGSGHAGGDSRRALGGKAAGSSRTSGGTMPPKSQGGTGGIALEPHRRAVSRKGAVIGLPLGKGTLGPHLSGIMPKELRPHTCDIGGNGDGVDGAAEAAEAAEAADGAATRKLVVEVTNYAPSDTSMISFTPLIKKRKFGRRRRVDTSGDGGGGGGADRERGARSPSPYGRSGDRGRSPSPSSPFGRDGGRGQRNPKDDDDDDGDDRDNARRADGEDAALGIPQEAMYMMPPLLPAVCTVLTRTDEASGERETKEPSRDAGTVQTNSEVVRLKRKALAQRNRNAVLLQFEQRAIEEEIRRRLRRETGAQIVDEQVEELRLVRRRFHVLRQHSERGLQRVRLTCVVPQLLKFPKMQAPPLVVRVGVSPNAGEQVVSLSQWKGEFESEDTMVRSPRTPESPSAPKSKPGGGAAASAGTSPVVVAGTAAELDATKRADDGFMRFYDPSSWQVFQVVPPAAMIGGRTHLEVHGTGFVDTGEIVVRFTTAEGVVYDVPGRTVGDDDENDDDMVDEGQGTGGREGGGGRARSGTGASGAGSGTGAMGGAGTEENKSNAAADAAMLVSSTRMRTVECYAPDMPLDTPATTCTVSISAGLGEDGETRLFSIHTSLVRFWHAPAIQEVIPALLPRPPPDADAMRNKRRNARRRDGGLQRSHLLSLLQKKKPQRKKKSKAKKTVSDVDSRIPPKWLRIAPGNSKRPETTHTGQSAGIQAYHDIDSETLEIVGEDLFETNHIHVRFRAVRMDGLIGASLAGAAHGIGNRAYPSRRRVSPSTVPSGAMGGTGRNSATGRRGQVHAKRGEQVVYETIAMFKPDGAKTDNEGEWSQATLLEPSNGRLVCDLPPSISPDTTELFVEVALDGQNYFRVERRIRFFFVAPLPAPKSGPMGGGTEITVQVVNVHHVVEDLARRTSTAASGAKDGTKGGTKDVAASFGAASSASSASSASVASAQGPDGATGGASSGPTSHDCPASPASPASPDTPVGFEKNRGGQRGPAAARGGKSGDPNTFATVRFSWVAMELKSRRDGGGLNRTVVHRFVTVPKESITVLNSASKAAGASTKADSEEQGSTVVIMKLKVPACPSIACVPLKNGRFPRNHPLVSVAKSRAAKQTMSASVGVQEVFQVSRTLTENGT